MPEMLRYSGQRFRVFKRAHRTCDTVDYIGGRHLKRTVHLEGLRCDGSAHGDCQALCLLFWKEAWLKKVDGPESPGTAVLVARPAENGTSSTACVWRGTRKAGEAADSLDPTYVCQATKLLDATVPLKRSDLEPYIEDLTSGNVGLGQMLGRLVFVVFSFIVGGRYGLSTPLIWLYDTVQKLTGGTPYPERRGKIPEGRQDPLASSGSAGRRDGTGSEPAGDPRDRRRGIAKPGHDLALGDGAVHRSDLPGSPSYREDHQREDGKDDPHEERRGHSRGCRLPRKVHQQLPPFLPPQRLPLLP